MNITPKEYAEAKNISLQAVTKRIRKKNSLPGVAKITKYGRFYVLQLKKDFVLPKKDLVV